MDRNIPEIDQWQDGPRNEVPVGVQGQGHHRLDVEVTLRAAVGRPDALVVVILEWNTDQGRDRVRQLFGQVGPVVCWSAVILRMRATEHQDAQGGHIALRGSTGASTWICWPAHLHTPSQSFSLLIISWSTTSSPALLRSGAIRAEACYSAQAPGYAARSPGPGRLPAPLH